MSPAGSTQGSQHVELPCLESVSGEGLTAGAVEMTREPIDSTQDLQRRHVQVRALSVPCRDDVVHLVAALRGSSVRHLIGHWD